MTTTPTSSTLEQTYAKFIQTSALKDTLYSWNGANVWVFKKINAIRGDSYDAIMLTISKLANHNNFPYYLAAMFIWAVLSILIKKMRRQGGSNYYLSMWLGIFLVAIIGYAVNGETIKFVKTVASFPRPYIALENVQGMDRKIDDADDDYRSFPSGHVAFATMMLIALWPALSEGIRWLGVLALMSVGWSRMALGMHFPADVVGGFLITLIVISLLRLLIYSSLNRLFGIRC